MCKSAYFGGVIICGGIYFDLSESRCLTNGDKITLFMDTNVDSLAQHGIILSDNTMEPTVYYFALSEQNIAINDAGELVHTASGYYKYPASYEELKEDRIAAYNRNVFESADETAG